MDTSLLLWINGLPHADWIHAAVLVVSLFGKSSVMMGAAFTVGAIGWLLKIEDLRNKALFFGLCVLLTSAAVILLKDAIHRPRPILAFSHLRMVGHAYGGSLPSGHAAVFAAWASFMVLFLKRSKWLWAGIAFLGGVVRIYQGAHYPSDVLAGWAVGFCVVWIVYRASLKVKKNRDKVY